MKNPTKTPRPEVQTVQATELIAAPEFFQPKTSRVRAAVDLYKRGINVFPVPSPLEVRPWAAANGKDPTDKPPYILKPFYQTRLHLCNPECRRREVETGQRCLPEAATFESLMYAANVAAMVGRTSGNLFDIDCDTPEAFRIVGDMLLKFGLPLWGFRTGRGGGYLGRLAESNVGNLRDGECLIPNTQVWCKDQYVTLPPSVHNNGTVYEWTTTDPAKLAPYEGPPVVSVEQLTWLGYGQPAARLQRLELHGLPEWTAALSDKNRRILASTPDHGTRNMNLTNPVYDMAALIVAGKVGYKAVDALILAFCQRTNYPWSDAAAMLKSALRKSNLTASKDFYGTNQATAPNEAYQRAQAFANAYSWKAHGRTAQTDRAIFYALLERSRVEAAPTFRASVRELSELANCTAKTAQAALQRLQGLRAANAATSTPALIKRAWYDDSRQQANTYTFTLPDMPTNTTTQGGGPSYYSTSTCSPSVLLRSPLESTLQDVFYTRPAVRRVYEHLQAQAEGTAGAIARATGQHARTVRRCLRWLQDHGLITRSTAEGLYVAESRTGEQLETLAAKMGTLGKSDARKRLHQKERERRANLQLLEVRRFWVERFHYGATMARRGNSRH